MGEKGGMGEGRRRMGEGKEKVTFRLKILQTFDMLFSCNDDCIHRSL